MLDVDVTPELELEGQARDLIRLVQQARRDADLAVTDRIDLRITADAGWVDAARTHEALIAAETLATSLEIDDSGSDTPARSPSACRPDADRHDRRRGRRGQSPERRYIAPFDLGPTGRWSAMAAAKKSTTTAPATRALRRRRQT